MIVGILVLALLFLTDVIAVIGVISLIKQIAESWYSDGWMMRIMASATVLALIIGIILVHIIVFFK